MRVFIHAKPSSKKECVQQLDATHFSITVKSPARDGKANTAIERALADFLNVPVWKVTTLHGHASRQKIVEVRE